MKGNITNIPLILIVTLTLAISVLTAYTILGSVIDATDDTMIDQEVLGEAETALGVFDYGIVFVNASFYVASLILGFKIRTSPVFAVPALLFLGLSVWLSAELANIYHLFGLSSPFSAAASSFSVTTQYFQSLPLITVGFGVLLVVVIYTGLGRSEVRA